MGWRQCRPSLNRQQRGAVAIMAAPLMIMMVGITALAVDIGRIMVVRNELQNAADAAALAGAARFGSYIQPDWSAATAAAQVAITRSRSERTALTSGTIEAGFWPVTGAGPMRPYNSAPTVALPGENPAVRVTITRADGVNGGPMQLFFAPILGVFAQNVSASAVSVVSTPGFASEGTLFPMVLNKCMFDQFWANGAPLDSNQKIRIGSAYHYDNCSAGQWTSLDLFSQSARVAKSLLVDGNHAELNILDDTFIQSGTETSIYAAVQQLVDAHGGQLDVLMPVVDSADLSHSGPVPIVAFAPFRITAAVGGSGKYIEGSFIPNFKAQGTSGGQGGGGAFFGATTPAILAK